MFTSPSLGGLPVGGGERRSTWRCKRTDIEPDRAWDPEERKRIQRANQIFLRLKKQLHDREGGFAERDIGEAAQGARWLQEVVERHPEGLEAAYEDALAESGLPERTRPTSGAG